MIQRIQTIYLLLATAIMATIHAIPLAQLTNDEGIWDFYSYGIKSISGDTSVSIDTLPIAVIIALAAILSFIAIFGYKNRKRQVKITILSSMFTLLFYPIALIYWWYSKDAVLATETSLNAILIFPIVAFILDIMAIRSINADERLVRSADRIR